MDPLVVGGLFMTLWVALIVACCWPRCRHQWEKGEVKEYPPAVGLGDIQIKGNPDAILKLKQSHTTFVQRCAKCGLERYHTESRPEV